MPRRPVFGGGQAKPTLEIRPTSSFVVLYGTHSEAPPAELTGNLILTNPESMPVRCIKVWLTGIRKVSWMTNTVTPQPVMSKRTFLHKEVPIYPTDGSRKQAHTIGAGVHEWPFRFEIPGNTDESVEGLISSYIIYELHASVDRGYMTKDLTAKKHIRIVRTLGQDMMEAVPMEQINDDIWANKVAYRIVVPQKNYIVGTSIHADFTMIPLKKGLTIGKIKMEVIENMVLSCETAGHHTQFGKETVVATMEAEMPANSERTVTPEIEALGPEHLFDECYHFNLALDLPKSLKSCRQSVETENIKLVHKLRLYVNLNNPEGHTSQLLVKNHLHLFISPNLPPGEDQSVVVDANVLNAAAMQDEAMLTAPPTYGRHQLDELYHGIDTTGFQSTPVSAAQTPFYGLSRNPSSEQLPSLFDAVAQLEEGEGASASQLHSRLSNLRLDQDHGSAFSRPSRTSSHYSSGVNTPYSGTEDSSTNHSSTHHSRQGSNEGYFSFAANGLRCPDYDMEALARTPSYNTAVRTPARTPTSENLPTYEAATSTPASPVLRRSEANQPSPSGSLETLREETERNTRLNSRRSSPIRGEGILSEVQSTSRALWSNGGISRSSSPRRATTPDASLTPRRRRFGLHLTPFGNGSGASSFSGVGPSQVLELVSKAVERHSAHTATRPLDRTAIEL